MFLNPVMLAGIGGAVVPLVLHFLSRSRFKTVDWGGMMFLGERERRFISGGAVRTWTLLAIRMGIVGLLAVALARPVVAGWWDGGGKRAVVLVVDCSASMGVEEAAGRTRMDLAKEAAMRVLARTNMGDMAGLVVMGMEGAGAGAATLGDVHGVIGRVGELEVRNGAADVARGLEAALELSERAGVGVRREIYVIGDRQARSWDGVGDAFAAEWQGKWATARRETRLYFVPVGSERVENVGIESVEVMDGPAVKGQPVGVEVRVRNYGRQARVGVGVEIGMKGTGIYSNVMNVEPGAVEVVRATVKFREVGNGAVHAEIKAQDLVADNRVEAGVAVREPLKVMVVGKAEYARLALAPFGTDGANLAVVAAGSGEDEKVAFDGMDAVVVGDVRKLPDGVAARLEQFVFGGGGLVIAPGPGNSVEEFGRLLWRNGAGVMPAAIAEGGSVGGTSLMGVRVEHPVFRFLRGAGGGVPAVSVEKYFRAEVREGDAAVLGTYGTGEPFVVEGGFGKGRVLLVTTPLGGEWSDLPLTSFYLPFVQSCVRYVADRGGERAVARGIGAESDLAVLGEEAWERVRRAVGFEETTRAEGLGLLAGLGREMWLPLLAGVVGLMVVEGVVARAWGPGNANAEHRTSNIERRTRGRR